MVVLLGMFGLSDVLIGPPYDPGIALGLTGLTHAEIQAERAAGYRLLDFYTRAGGFQLTAMSVVLAAILLVPYRAGHAWAWWIWWIFPAWTAGVFALNAMFGVAPRQVPPPPMLSAPILGILAAVALLFDRVRFLDAEAAEPELATA